MTPGLANKLTKPFVRKILTTFEETLSYLPKDKGVYTGSPVRESLIDGNKENGYSLTGFTKEKPIIMMMGGSIGSVKINSILRDSLPTLLNKFQIVHLCGKGNHDHSLDSLTNYKQYDFISSELKDLFAITDIMLSRAGSNAINEFLYLQIPSLLIPLSKNASRGDQILNAEAFKKKGFSYVLEEEDLTRDALIEGLNEVYDHRESYLSAIQSAPGSCGALNVFNELMKLLN
jgi:UDP-N-acetylglucosamine--N-acetylmuramyl-(pentapeptide) pyrophosphoryl-undecaprenol N-acetylglucosamine transferase